MDPDKLAFQCGMRLVGEDRSLWNDLLRQDVLGQRAVSFVLEKGRAIRDYNIQVDSGICNDLTWLMEWEGLKFLCVNHARFNSLLFAVKDNPATGHDALLGFRFDGIKWMVSLYHANHRKDLDLSEIAKKHGGGGHRGASGFVCQQLPFKL